jgi:hypothetical protein
MKLIKNNFNNSNNINIALTINIGTDTYINLILFSNIKLH